MSIYKETADELDKWPKAIIDRSLLQAWDLDITTRAGRLAQGSFMLAYGTMNFDFREFFIGTGGRCPYCNLPLEGGKCPQGCGEPEEE